MNKKIKEISINAFRAYEDEQKFNLMHRTSGKVADLVAIYAPNGYGKTSFFDAVEWAVTGTIDRLNVGTPIKEEVRNVDTHILKNRGTEAEFGNVTIISEDDGIFSVNTKKKTGRMKSDFKQGDTVKISSQLATILDEKDTFCTTNLLAHDKITGFLQNYTAENKTDELTVMWDESNYSEILKEIIEIYNELEKRKKQLESAIVKEKKELKTFTYENDQNEKVINLLLEYENGLNRKFLEDTTFEVEEMLTLFQLFHEASQKEREEKEKECSDSELLLRDFSMYEDNKRSISILQKEKAECTKAISIWEKKELIQVKQDNIEKELKQILVLLGKLKEFYDLVEKNNYNILELGRIEKCKIDYQKQQVNIHERISKLDKNLQDNKKEIEKLDEKKAQLIQSYSEFNNNMEKKAKYERLSKKAKYILEQRNKRNQTWNLYIEQIDLFLKGRLGIGLLYDIFSNEIFAKYNLVKKLNDEKQLLNENNIALENSRKNLVGLYDKIQQLSIKGRNIVIEQKANECPLCHMKYQKHEVLLDKIDAATQENIELEKIDELIRKNKDRVIEIDAELKMLIDNVENEVLVISNEYKEKCFLETKKIKQLQATIEMWDTIINAAGSICSKLKDKYQSEEIDISLYEQVYNKEMEMEKYRKKINKEINEIQNDINTERIKENELEQNIKSCELKILEIKEESNEINTNQLYIEVKNILKDKEYFDSNYGYVEMKVIIEIQYNQLIEKKMILDKEAEGYHIENMLPKDEYVEKLNECQKEINRLQVDTSGYIMRCEKLLGEVKEAELLNEIIKTNGMLKENLKSINNRIQEETTIIVRLNGLKEQKMWMVKKQNLETDKAALALLNKRIEKLQESRDLVEDYIMNKTNEYFNSDIINQIYNKIDPHPTMKHIKFVTQKNNGVLKTHIYTYDESESNKMSPVVYLSSAQVNILSLCIFLSKVISEKNTTFNTIFMDDPIQHLDGINLLSFIDVLRTITTDFGRQIVISTHNEQFYKLLKVKMDERYYSSRFIELTSTGRIKA